MSALAIRTPDEHEALHRCKWCDRRKPREEMVTRGNSALSICLPCAEAGRSSTVRQQRADRREALGHAHVDQAPDPAPARLLAELLRYDRQFGIDFDQAWAEGVAFVLDRIAGHRQLRAQERAGWTEAFNTTRGAWEAAWRRLPGGPGSGLSPALLDTLSRQRSSSRERA